jgi:hypothetical protein
VFFPYSTECRRPVEPTHLNDAGNLSDELKRQELEADHSSRSNFEVKNGGVTLLRQPMHSQQYKNIWKCNFLCGPCRIKRNLAISSSQNFLFVVYLMTLSLTELGSSE